MITIISGTNRPNSRTLAVANYVREATQEVTKAAVELIDLVELNPGFLSNTMYESANSHPELRQLQNDFILPAKKLIFVAPEYNGSYPGVLKAFLDALSVHRYKENFMGKPVALIGTATGRAGNLRGMDHLSQSLLHMGAELRFGALPISQVDKLLDEHGQLADAETKSAIIKHIGNLIRI